MENQYEEKIKFLFTILKQCEDSLAYLGYENELNKRKLTLAYTLCVVLAVALIACVFYSV